MISVAISFSRAMFSLNMSWYSMIVVLFSTFGQCCRTCSCVSFSFAQNLHTVSVSLALLKFAFAASIEALVFIMALYCFLVSLSMLAGLFPTCMFSFLSFQCLTLVLFWVSFSTLSRILVLISSWIRRFRLFLFVIDNTSFRWSSPAVFFYVFPPCAMCGFGCILY